MSEPLYQQRSQGLPVRGKFTWAGHLAIARLDHWVKNVFVLPGIVVAATTVSIDHPGIIARALIGLVAIGFVASSNYTLNEIIDAPYDRNHPTKRLRPVPSGQVNVPLGYLQWLLLGILGVGGGLLVNLPFAITLLALWIMGCGYNIPPVRAKDIPYLDVLVEAINNPIRMVAGWFIVTATVTPPLTLLLSYWMIGCYFMTIKRFAERRELGAREQVAQYRPSLAALSEERLLTVTTFYAAASMLFFGAFIIRYRLELVLAFPFVSWVMAVYLELAFRPDSGAQHPEKLYREAKLMAAVTVCFLVMGALLLVDLPLLYRLFQPMTLSGTGR